MTYLDPDVLARVRALDLSARRTVDGLLAGAHRSPRHGFAVEFAQHREYVPGDDVKHLDWKVFGRTERYYLKQYELETDLTAWLVLDTSASLKYQSGEISKYDYASTLVATLAHLAVRQGDRVGFAAVDDRVRRLVRAAGQSGQLQEILRALVAGPGTTEAKLGAALSELAGRIDRRGIVIVVSDFLDDAVETLEGFRRLRFDRHEMIAVRVIDPAEEDFPFASPTLFRGLEIPLEMITDPRGLRQAYREEYAAHHRELVTGLRDLGADVLEARTDIDPGRTLAQFLSGRS
ncbi:MAG: DUF58 domain-containing protein [Gemmataceae bacterium]|nr:DUF58 domain-containing protein [Gemmataceae bacterium]